MIRAIRLVLVTTEQDARDGGGPAVTRKNRAGAPGDEQHGNDDTEQDQRGPEVVADEDQPEDDQADGTT